VRALPGRGRRECATRQTWPSRVATAKRCSPPSPSRALRRARAAHAAPVRWSRHLCCWPWGIRPRSPAEPSGFRSGAGTPGRRSIAFAPFCPASWRGREAASAPEQPAYDRSDPERPPGDFVVEWLQRLGELLRARVARRRVDLQRAVHHVAQPGRDVGPQRLHPGNPPRPQRLLHLIVVGAADGALIGQGFVEDGSGSPEVYLWRERAPLELLRREVGKLARQGAGLISVAHR